MASSNGQNGNQSTGAASETFPSFRPLVLSYLRLVLATASAFTTLTKIPFDSRYLSHLTNGTFNPEHFADYFSNIHRIATYVSSLHDSSIDQWGNFSSYDRWIQMISRDAHYWYRPCRWIKATGEWVAQTRQILCQRSRFLIYVTVLSIRRERSRSP